MNRLTITCALIALASPALHAPRAADAQPNAQSSYNIQQNMQRAQQQRMGAYADTDRHTARISLANLTKLRAKLAEAWQALGMTQESAKAVAAAYDPNFALNARRASLQGKSDAEIAAVLQAALARKDYQLANQTLIDFERGRLNLGADTAPDGQR